MKVHYVNSPSVISTIDLILNKLLMEEKTISFTPVAWDLSVETLEAWRNGECESARSGS
jgi:hypothetical protein